MVVNLVYCTTKSNNYENQYRHFRIKKQQQEILKLLQRNLHSLDIVLVVKVTLDVTRCSRYPNRQKLDLFQLLFGPMAIFLTTHYQITRFLRLLNWNRGYF